MDSHYPLSAEAQARLGRIAFVLHGLRSPDNLGAVARAMKNNGLSSLALADPFTHAIDKARKMAVGAEDLLDGLFVHLRIEDALAGAVFTAGTTSRAIRGRSALTPRQLAQALLSHAAQGRVAVLFGSEKRGLSDPELDLCQAVVTIPAAPPQPSLNLAQAAAIIGYEIYQAALGPLPEPAPRERATAGQLEALYVRTRSALLAAGFLNPQNPDAILSELKRSLERAQLSPREAELWLSAMRAVERSLG